MKRFRCLLRLLCLVVGGWLALFLAVNVVILLSGMAARGPGGTLGSTTTAGPTSRTCASWETGC